MQCQAMARVKRDAGVPLRVAAYMLALDRVAAAELERGFD